MPNDDRRKRRRESMQIEDCRTRIAARGLREEDRKNKAAGRLQKKDCKNS